MNKIVIDTDKYDLIVDNDNYSIEVINTRILNIKVLENVSSKMTILIQNTDIFINIDLEKSSNLVINQLVVNASLNLNVNLFSYASISFVSGLISLNDTINNINIMHKESNSKSKIIINGVNLENKKFYLTMNGYIPKTSLNCVLDENSKIINLKDGDSKIIPNLIIDNKEVIANHSAFIGKFDLDKINYLKSRGIKMDDIYNLLLKSNLLSGMDLFVDKDRFIYFIRNIK